MDQLFFLGQVVSIAVLAYGAYLSFSNAHLADPESARTASGTPDQAIPPAMQTGPGRARFIVSP